MNFRKTKNNIFIFLLFIIVFPALQQNFTFFKSGPLTGAQIPIVNPPFNWDKWLGSDFQADAARYLNDNMGCRSDFVRINNQIDYSLFTRFHAGEGLLIGKNDYLFEGSYIDEYNGLDYTGDSEIRQAAIKLKRIQDTIEKSGKTFVFAIAPSKAWFFSSYFPARYDTLRKKGGTTSQALALDFSNCGIHLIDYNNWFLSAKDTSKELLFDHLGIHWTTYGALLAEDSMISYIAQLRHQTIPHPEWNTVEHSENARLLDDDLAQWLNIIAKLNIDKLAYPQYHYTQSGEKPKVILLGDSFCWPWVKCNFIEEATNNGEFWYYFREIWTVQSLKEGHPQCEIKDYDWHSQLLHTDCLIMLFTPPNLRTICTKDGVIDKVYSFYFPAG